MSYWCQKPPDRRQERSVLQLITAIKHLSWDDVEDRLRKHPNEASETDKFNVTALFHAIRKRHCSVPIHIISALIEAHPQSLEIVDHQTGNNALHIACMNSGEDATHDSNNEVVTMIIEANPNGTKHLSKEGKLPLHRAKNVDIASKLIQVYPQGLGIATKNYKYLPLHSACSDNTVPPDVVKLLIEHGRDQEIGKACGPRNDYCGGVLSEDIYGEIPLKILFKRILFGSKSTEHGLLIDQHSPLWDKLCIVAKATFEALQCFPMGWQSKPTPLVHAIIECGGHPKIVQHALMLHPEEINFRDERGKTPLMIAAGKVNTLPEIFELLLSDASAAEMSDSDGRMPLHLAVASGRTLNNGVAMITKAAPLALQTCDRKTRMYPFMLASVPTYGWDNTCIDTIYTLLRDAPNVMQSFCDEDQSFL